MRRPGLALGRLQVYSGRLYRRLYKRAGKISVSGFAGAQKQNEALPKSETKTEKVESNSWIVFCFFCIFGGIGHF